MNTGRKYSIVDKLGLPVDFFDDYGSVGDDASYGFFDDTTDTASVPEYYRNPAQRFSRTPIEVSIDHITEQTKDMNFYADGGCRGSEENFHGYERPSVAAMEKIEQAKQVCRSCVVRQECLDWAIANVEFENPYAIYGGEIVKDILAMQ